MSGNERVVQIILGLMIAIRALWKEWEKEK
jgi:hypothetical protein